MGPANLGLSLQESNSWQLQASDEALENLIFIDAYWCCKKPIYRSEVLNPLSHLDEAKDSEQKAQDSLDAGWTFPPSWAEEDIFRGLRRWPSKDVNGPQIQA